MTEVPLGGPAARTGRGSDSHARRVGPGWYVKIILMAAVNALGLYGAWSAVVVGSWGVAVFLALAVAAADWVYFSRRMLPGKYLYPGLLFLLAFQLFVMLYTGYVAFTNYGDGHNSTKQDAIAAISAQNERRVEGSATYPVTVVERDGELGLAILRDGEAVVGDADTPLEPAAGSDDGARVTAVDGWTTLDFAALVERSAEITELRVPFSDDPADGGLRTQDGSLGFVAAPRLVYDDATDTFTDSRSGATYAPDDHGNFVSAGGEALTPGWRVGVGLENFTAIFTEKGLAGPFLQVLVWTFAFAALSVITTFGLGLFLAMVFDDPRVKGRKVYRALLILPYAFPAFLATLVWRGMLNERFGWVNEVLLGGADVPWLTDPLLAKFSVLAVNLWLGFPYMFLVCTGALQSIPGDVVESARVDGASRLRTIRSIVLPLLMVSTAPLLISSFAFNFNNFALIYMLTGGGPHFEGAPVLVGHTDILISMVYSVAFESGVKQYGLASAVSLLIFVIVGVISWLGFRRTRTLEEL
ncbi:ABC transporter permease subunit [Myceligenerans crystallogenes]|uniref:Maltose/maltodextrin transport system permease protein n=1 Tax=Myceligenerans crystallogenes TaxID=316335 RepID=A0ABN2NGJ5_9MICO